MVCSCKKPLNKALKRASKRINKYRNPLDKTGRLAVESTEIASKVVSDVLKQARDEVDRILQVTANKMEEVRSAKKLVGALREQFKQNPEEMRKLLDYSRNTLEVVSDGVVDIIDEVSTSYDLYEDERKGRMKAKPAAS